MAPMMRPISTAHLDLDGAWPHRILEPLLDLRHWGPRLRYSATPALLDSFFDAVQPSLPAFTLFGSGDFHHLSALWLRNLSLPVCLVSFDNHPDWDIRPPRWGCGGWINRALELAAVRQAHVWGCGNFELVLPSLIFANRRAVKLNRLQIHPWSERQPESVQKRFDCMNRENWRARFELFAATLTNTNVYITVDIDCLTRQDAASNWEHGLFTAGDIDWAIRVLRSRANVLAGDMCGAYSPLKVTGPFRRFATWWDHPKLQPVSIAEARQINLAAFKTIWPALIGH